MSKSLLVAFVIVMAFVAAIVATAKPPQDPLAGLDDKAYIEQVLGCKVDVSTSEENNITMLLQFEGKPAPGIFDDTVILHHLRSCLHGHPTTRQR